MSNPEHESKPNECLLPVVTEGVVVALSADIAAQEGFIKENLDILQGENPILAEALARLAMVYGSDTKTIKKLTMTGLVVYRALRNQAEVDGLNGSLATGPELES